MTAPISMSDTLAALESQRRHTLKSFWLTMLFLLAALASIAGPFVILVQLDATIDTGTLERSLGKAVHAWPSVHPSVFLALFIAWPLTWAVAGFVALKRFALRPRWAYISAFKTQVFTALCREHFPGLTFEPHNGIPWKLLDNSKLFTNNCDIYRSEDRFSGRVGATDVAFCEAHAQREVKRLIKGENDPTWETYFKGIIFIADFHKHFHCSARLIPEGEKVARVRKEKPVTLEDPAFEARFQTVASDQIDIRYLLSSSMMARFTELHRRFPRLRARFKDEQLMLLLPSSRNRFEPSLYRRAHSPRQMETFIKEVRACLAVVDELNLNTRIWSKT